MKFLLYLLLALFLGVGACAEEESEPPTLEHILEVLKATEAKIQSVDMQIEVRSVGVAGAGSSSTHRVLIRHVYDDRGRLFHENRRQFQEPQRALFRDSDIAIFTDDGEWFTRYHPSPAIRKSEKYFLRRWQSVDLGAMYMDGQLPGDFCHIWGKSLAQIVEESIEGERVPEVEVRDGMVYLSFVDFAQYIPLAPGKVVIELDPAKDFVMTRRDSYDKSGTLRERVVMNVTNRGGIWHWWIAYRQMYGGKDEGRVEPVSEYHVEEFRFNAEYPADTLFAIDKEPSNRD